MNEKRQEVLAEVRTALDAAYEKLKNVKENKQDAFNNLPVSLQVSEEGFAMTEAIDAMDAAEVIVIDAIAELDNIA